jgi:hypothetical protein
MTTQNLFDSRFMEFMTPTYFAHVCDIYVRTPGAMDGVGQYSSETWAVDQASVDCTMYYSSEVMRFKMAKNTVVDEDLMIVLPESATVGDNGYRIVTTETGFAGTYDITRPHRDDMGNWIAILQKVLEP